TNRSTTSPPNLTLYDQELPRADFFSYLGIPFRATGAIDPIRLIQQNSNGTLHSMRILNTIGLSTSGFNRLLTSRLNRPKLEYGLAITKFTLTQLALLESTQAQCLRLCYGSHRSASTSVMRHLTNLPSMAERVAYLQAKFVLRAHRLPDDTLLATVVAHLTNSSTSHWSKLQQTTLWARLTSQTDNPNASDL
ncbi:hypothetical protein EC973_007541, partial [Apophysomyces ossiformis]